MLKCDTIIHLVLNLYVFGVNFGVICKWKLIWLATEKCTSRYLQFLCNVYFIIYFCVCEVIRMKVYTKTHSCIKRFLVWPLFSLSDFNLVLSTVALVILVVWHHLTESINFAQIARLMPLVVWFYTFKVIVHL